jgi:hypothetical protein
LAHIKRTEQYPPFQCPGCPAPTPNPRLARMNILLVDLRSPWIHFKLTPPGENLPAVAPGSTTPNWPVVPFEVVRQRTLDFLKSSRPAEERLRRLERAQPGRRRLHHNGGRRPRDARAEARERARRQPAAPGGRATSPLTRTPSIRSARPPSTRRRTRTAGTRPPSA